MRHLFPDVLFMRRRDFIDESFRLFPGKPAVSGLREYFHVEFTSFLSQPVKPGGQLLSTFPFIPYQMCAWFFSDSVQSVFLPMR